MSTSKLCLIRDSQIVGLRTQKALPKIIFLHYGKFKEDEIPLILHDGLLGLYIYPGLEIRRKKLNIEPMAGNVFMNQLGQTKSIQTLKLTSIPSLQFLGAVKSSWILSRNLLSLTLRGISKNQSTKGLLRLLQIFSSLKSLTVGLPGKENDFIASVQLSILCTKSTLESIDISKGQDLRLLSAVLHRRKQLKSASQLEVLTVIGITDFKFSPGLISEILKQADIESVKRSRVLSDGVLGFRNCSPLTNNLHLDWLLRSPALGCVFS